jgi:hypothetical protein
MPKNIKIDNMTFDGSGDMNWEDFVNVYGSEDDSEDYATGQQDEQTTKQGDEQQQST